MIKHITLVLLALLVSSSLQAQSVTVGKGSYSTVLKSNQLGPELVHRSENEPRRSAYPKVTSDFSKPFQTNDFWSSLIYPFSDNPFSAILYAYPVNFRAVAEGMEMGYTDSHIFAAADHLYPYSKQLLVSVAGLSATSAKTKDYSDWTVVAEWADSNQKLIATIGHGLPFAFYEIEGGDAIVNSDNPSIWYNQDGVIGLTVAGKHYGIFAPSGSTWSGTSSLRSDLSGKGFFSVALLPNNSESTLELYKTHAYAFVRDTRVAWSYDENSAMLTTTYEYETELMDDREGNVNETITALLRHQYTNSSTATTNLTYMSPRGLMKVKTGNTFATSLKFNGILPALPDRGDYNPEELNALIDDIEGQALPIRGTYENGKDMASYAHLIHIAEQMGDTDAVEFFIAELKKRLEDWLTAGGDQEYVYIDRWDVMTGYPSGFGADTQINDHHFHAAYAVISAATIAKYDPEWAKQENWGGMINLLIKDANNWDRNDDMFPFLRSHDAYAGHSWAAGHGDFAEGNNQESSSESMNFAAATFLWGMNTGQKEIRDFGIFLHTNEASAIENYWFDVYDEVFPQDYPHVAIGMVWGGKGVHSTWFGGAPEFIHGINILPVTSASLYLGHHPDYVIKNFNEIDDEANGIGLWKDVLWKYLALADPDRALSYYYADPNYEVFDGETRASTLHWLENMKKLGHVDTTITANTPSYAVFRNSADELTYTAYNPSEEPLTVTFSDGQELQVQPKQMATRYTGVEDASAPVAKIVTNSTWGKAPLTIAFTGSNSFDRNGEALTYDWDFGNGITSSKADTTIIYEEVGSFWAYLTVTNQSQLSAKDSLEITVLDNGTPFGGSMPQIPAIIEAENYDVGGEGVAYHDVDRNNIGLAFRPDEGVDLTGTGDGTFAVYWMVDGEWLEYTFEAPEDGNYDIKADVSTVPGFGAIQFLIDNVQVSSKIPVTGTGSFENFVRKGPENVAIKQGVHRLRIEVSSDSDETGWLYSMNKIRFIKNTSNSIDESYQPSAFQVFQNYPNPFNPETNIKIELPNSSALEINVFDVNGRLIQKLSNGQMYATGVHQFTFDGSNLASGMYFVTVRTDFGFKTLKMTLLK